MSVDRTLDELLREFVAVGEADAKFTVMSYDQASFGDALIQCESSLGQLRILRDRGVYLLEVLTSEGAAPIEIVAPATAPLVAGKRPLREILAAWQAANAA